MKVLRTPDKYFANIKGYPFDPIYTDIFADDGTEIRIHHIDEGPSDGPILLAMHGQPVWSYLYSKMIPILNDAGIRVIAPDLVGYGKSDKPASREDYSYQNQVNWMNEWLIKNDLNNLIFFGQDWGGLIGLRMIADNPDRFIKVSMGNTGLPYVPNTSKEVIDKVKELINLQKNSEAIVVLENCQLIIEEYADSYSKNQNIKKDSVKRNERISIIDKEIESWKNLLSNSEKMVSELTDRKNKLNLQLEKLDNQPKLQAEKKGQISEGLRISEKEKEDNESIIHSTDEKIDTLRAQLNEVQEQSIQIRERKASSGATIEGLKKRKSDLIDRITSELNLTEENILENSSLYGAEDLPDAVNQEDLLDKKRQEREKLGSVNLKADEETNKYEAEIKKMEQDRADLVSAIVKLKDSINELNQKGRERLIEAFEKVNRKFNEVYTKLFNGGNAKLELVDSEDPLEAGLEMLVSPPGKRLQSITLLSGGEQALTALSLIFAVFLTNPSPICVLDEVDAPLDDANVTRFCSLLEELIKITNTKFIIVTHHALTMSKMNRLYGVTMPEKGISQLVAVDLQKAESMVA